MRLSCIRIASCLLASASLVAAAPKTKPTPAKDAPHKAPNPTRPSLYKNAEHGLQIQMPAGWEDGQLSMPGAIAVFFPPGEKDGSISLFTRDPAGKDVDAVLTQLQSEIKSHDANAELDPLSDAKLGGEPARTFTYRVTLGGEKRSGVMLASIHAGKAYVFKYSGPTAEYEKDVAAAQRLMGSLKWTKSSAGATTKPGA